jgi:hypothetical protein
LTNNSLSLLIHTKLKKFRQLFDKKGRSLNDNYRPIQEEHGRIITYHSDNNLEKYTQTGAQSHQQFKSWDEKTLEFFKHSGFNSKDFFKWQPFKDIGKFSNFFEIPNWNFGMAK